MKQLLNIEQYLDDYPKTILELSNKHEQPEHVYGVRAYLGLSALMIVYVP
jgi:hypothetical protein